MMQVYENVPRGTFLQVEEFKAELLKWNKKINLISKNDEAQIDKRHLADSMQLLNYLPENKDIKIIDFGSGAGFPGVVLAISGYKNIVLVESDIKKAIFLENVGKMLGLSYKVENKRIEELKPESQYDFITARALAPVTKLLEYSEKFLHNEIKLLLLKGMALEQEIKEAQKKWSFSYKKHRSKVDESGYIVEIELVSKKI